MTEMLWLRAYRVLQRRPAWQRTALHAAWIVLVTGAALVWVHTFDHCPYC